jgi:cellulose synthase operon protein B
MRTAALALLLSLAASAALAQPQPAAPNQATTVVPPPAPPASPDNSRPFPASGYTSYSFKDLGAANGFRLIEGAPEGGVSYSVRRDEVITAARLHMILANSAGFPSDARLQVTLNGDQIGTVDVGGDRHDATAVDLPIDPVLLGDYNRVNFKLLGVTVTSCRVNDTGPWLTIGSTSAIDIASDRLPLASDLSILPLPFVDQRDPHAVVASFVFAQNPTPATLEAAGIVATWLGSLAGYRGAQLPAAIGSIPAGNAIVFVAGTDSLPGVALPQAVGPTVAVTQNPVDPLGKLLLIMGRDAADLKTAARGLAQGGAAIKAGAVSAVTPADTQERPAYDVPGWLPDNRPVKFSELASEDELSSHGFRPDEIRLDFKASPDYFNWIDTAIPLRLRFHVTPERVVNLGASQLDVAVNGNWFRSLPLAQGTAFLAPDIPNHEQTVNLPPYLLTGRNRLTFYFSMVPSPECDAAGAASLTEDIDPNSTIDVSETPHYMAMPNLSFFANAGFPFTRSADLARTAVVMPDTVTPDDIEAFLESMALFGEATGYSGTRATVVRASDVGTVANRDLLLIGSYTHQRLLGDWSYLTGLAVEGGELRATPRSSWEKFQMLFEWRDRRGDTGDVNDWLQTSQSGESALIGFQSPLNGDRSVVAVTGSDSAHVVQASQILQSSDRLAKVQDGLVLARGNDIQSYRLMPSYDIGTISRWTWLRWNISDQPIVIAILLFAGCAALGAVAFVVLGVKARRRLQGANR